MQGLIVEIFLVSHNNFEISTLCKKMPLEKNSLESL